MGASVNSCNHPRVQRALDAMDRDKSHIPRVKDPISPDVLASIMRNLHDAPLMSIVRPAFLLLYYGALRQSEITSRTVASWETAIHPTRADLQIYDDRCTLFVKFGKNLQKVGQYRQVEMAAAADPLFCPVHTFRRVLRDTPTRQPSDPLLMFPDNRKPVPTTFLARVLQQELCKLGVSDISTVYHSTACAKQQLLMLSRGLSGAHH